MKLPGTKTRNILLQAAIIIVLVSMAALFGYNYYINITNMNIGVGFGFMDDTAGFSISQTLIEYEETDTFGRTFLVGLLNTLLASIISIILATVLGFFVGLMRLSKNKLLNQVSYGYIEFLRNIPPLLHVLFWYQVVFLKSLPPFNDSLILFDSVYINVRGVTIPEFHSTATTPGFNILLFVAIITIILLGYFKKRMVLRGVHKRFWPYQLGIVGLVIGAILMLKPYTVIMPVIERFRFTSGTSFRPELFSIIAAMSTYTSTYIADIVRSSIIAVPKGQLEAAKSLGFTSFLRLRLVIIPQAMRTMIPPVTNQYLNIIKNTSLGMAIAYPDLTAVFAGTTLNQTGRALEVMIIVMMTYLLISLTTSLFMNWYNDKIINKKGDLIEIVEDPE